MYDHLCMRPDEVEILIYHKNCVDGFGAAMSCMMASEGKNLIYIPMQHDDPLPDVTGKNVLLCDICFKKDGMAKLLGQANKLVVLDHHKTAEKEMIDLPDENKHFDMKHSGAYLAWCYFHPGKEIPKVILYIQDTDLWIKKLPNTQEISARIALLPFEFSAYRPLFEDGFEKEAIIYGRGALDQVKRLTGEILKFFLPTFGKIGEEYYLILMVETAVSSLKSTLGHAALEKWPLLDFSVVYTPNHSGKVNYSLRSEENRTDITKIVEMFKGGGHRNAGAFSYEGNFPMYVIRDCYIYETLKRIYFRSVVLPVRTQDKSICSISLEDCNDYMVTNYGENQDAVEMKNCVYLNYSGKGSHIAKYLLQMRTETLQVCEAIGGQKADMAIVWTGDGNNIFNTLVFLPECADFVNRFLSDKRVESRKGCEVTFRTSGKI